MHLRDADLLGDLRLGEVVDEAQLEDHLLALGQRLEGRGDGLTELHELVVGVAAAQRLAEGALALAVAPRLRRVQGGGGVGAGGIQGLQYLLEVQAGVLGQVARAGRAAEAAAQGVGRAVDHQHPLLHRAGHVQAPALVAEVALELAHDVGHRVAHERAAARVVAVDRLQQAQVRHLLEVVLRLARVPVAPGQPPGERHVAPGQLLARRDVARGVTAEQLLLARGRCQLGR